MDSEVGRGFMTPTHSNQVLKGLHMRSSGLLMSLLAAMTIARTGVCAEASTALEIGNRLEPFVDRYLFENTDNVTHRHGHIV